MTGKEFAERYVGREVRLINTTDVPCFERPNPIAIVVGYYDQNICTSILVKFVDHKDQFLSWKPHINVVLLQKAERIWSVALSNLELVVKSSNTYPHTCKKCKKPARKIGKVVLCSNVKCKSRGTFNKAFKSFIQYNEVLCPMCQNVGQYISDQWYGKATGKNYSYLNCSNAHGWSYVPKHYDAIIDKNKKRIYWSGSNWVPS
jgi:hypothetical protein